MRRYFFSTANGHYLKDEEGDILADDEAACGMAVDILSEILPSQRDQLSLGGQFSIFVSNESSAEIYEITATARRVGQ